MTSKERARLRGLANGIETVLQIGKDGIGENLIHQADITLEARELIKGRVLDGCMDYTPRTAAEALAQATDSEVVQVIGSKFVLYRKKKDAEASKQRKPASRPGQRAKAPLSRDSSPKGRDGDGKAGQKSGKSFRAPSGPDAGRRDKKRFPAAVDADTGRRNGKRSPAPMGRGTGGRVSRPGERKASGRPGQRNGGIRRK